MNKTIVTMSMVGAMVGVAVEPMPNEVVDDSKIQEITMQSTQPEERQHQFSFNLSYGISNNSENELYDCDLARFELECGYQFAPYQSVTLGLGIGGGGGDVEMMLPGNHRPRYFEYEYNRTSFTLMVGYRVQIPVTQSLSLAAGVKGGLDVQKLSLDYYPYDMHYDPYEDTYYSKPEQENSAVGFIYAAYAGLNYKINERTSLEVGYQFSSSSARPEARHEWERGCPHVKAPEWGVHEIRAGLRFNF